MDAETGPDDVGDGRDIYRNIEATVCGLRPSKRAWSWPDGVSIGGCKGQQAGWATSTYMQSSAEGQLGNIRLSTCPFTTCY